MATEDTLNRDETPPLAAVIQTAIAANRRNLHTALPARVTKVTSPQQVNVLPLLKRKYRTSPNPVALPEIQNVPVVSPRGAAYFTQLPVAVGDTGLILMSERSLDAWKVSGGLVDPKDVRTHNLTDAVFLPGLYPFSQPMVAKGGAADPTAMIVANGAAEVWLKAAGQFKLTNGENEFLALVNSILTQLIQVTTDLSTATTNTILGPQPLNNAAAFVAITTALASLQTQLATLLSVG